VWRGVGWSDRPTDRPTTRRPYWTSRERRVCVCGARARRVVYKRHNAYEVANVVMYARDDARRAREINRTYTPNVRTLRRRMSEHRPPPAMMRARVATRMARDRRRRRRSTT
jgi:hypothetical protein